MQTVVRPEWSPQPTQGIRVLGEDSSPRMEVMPKRPQYKLGNANSRSSRWVPLTHARHPRSWRRQLTTYGSHAERYKIWSSLRQVLARQHDKVKVPESCVSRQTCAGGWYIVQ
jgi:hypothetical protein